MSVGRCLVLSRSSAAFLLSKPRKLKTAFLSLAGAHSCVRALELAAVLLTSGGGAAAEAPTGAAVSEQNQRLENTTESVPCDIRWASDASVWRLSERHLVSRSPSSSFSLSVLRSALRDAGTLRFDGPRVSAGVSPHIYLLTLLVKVLPVWSPTIVN